MEHKEVISLITRYIILILLGLGSLYIFYFVFTPLTVVPVLKLLSLVDPKAYLVENTTNVIAFRGYFATIIPACIAGAAYYLLVILNLSTPMNLKKRIYSLIYILGLFLIINIFRIFVFAILFTNGDKHSGDLIDLTHIATWYFGSTIMVVLIWFTNVLVFRIRAIPIYTDLKGIYEDILIKKKPSRNKK